MQTKKMWVGIVAAIIFVVGVGFLVYSGRPVVTMQTPPTNTTIPPNGENPTGATNTYTLIEIASHNTQTNCWSAINGNVYDLTSWVSRHPGGAAPIISLCGTDGSATFTDQHGNSKRPASALILLKIGALK